MMNDYTTLLHYYVIFAETARWFTNVRPKDKITWRQLKSFEDLEKQVKEFPSWYAMYRHYPNDQELLIINISLPNPVKYIIE